MTWTYSGDPASTARDAVRFLIGDTDTTDQQISDEEVNWLITENGNNVYLAGSASARKVAAEFTRQVRTKTVGALSISYAARAQEYRDLADDLRQQASTKIALAVYAGGISRADKELQEADTDWDKPAFTRGMTDFVQRRRVDNLGFPV